MPDIEGVPYEAIGGKIDQVTAQALAARHREAAAAGVAAAGEAVAPVRSQVSALSSRVDSQDAKTLTDAKAYTDQKYIGLATTAAMQAGDQKSLTDAKAYTDEQVGQVGPGGGVYLDKEGNEKRFIYVVSDTDPGETRTIDGETVEVWWVQTTPPDPMQSTPIGVTQNVANRSYTVPSDPVATYTVDGVLKAAGTYSVSTAAQTLQWSAAAKAGYGFKSGAVTSGTLTYPAKTFVSGDVLVSDSFERADGNLAGTTSDSYAGGIPTIWSDAGGVTVITGGKITKHADSAYAWPKLDLPAPATSVAVEFIADFGHSENYALATLRTQDGKTIQFLASRETHFRTTSGSPVKVANTLAATSGDTIRMTVDTVANAASVRNMTTGATAAANAAPEFSSPITEFRADFRNTANMLREIKVFIP